MSRTRFFSFFQKHHIDIGLAAGTGIGAYYVAKRKSYDFLDMSLGVTVGAVGGAFWPLGLPIFMGFLVGSHVGDAVRFSLRDGEVSNKRNNDKQ